MTEAADLTGATAWPAVLPARLALFLQYWQGLSAAAGGGVPPRQAVDPLLIPRSLLPDIGLVEAQPSNGRLNLRFRLLGTGHRLATGRDYSGRTFDELYAPEQVVEFEREYGAILNSGKPAFARRSSLKQNREFILFRRILAPLLDDAGTPRHVIGYWHWESIDP